MVFTIMVTNDEIGREKEEKFFLCKQNVMI